MLKKLLSSLASLIFYVLLVPRLTYGISAGQQVEFKLGQEPFLTKKVKNLQGLWSWFSCSYPTQSKLLAEYLKISSSTSINRESIAKLAQLAKATDNLQLTSKIKLTSSKQIFSQALKQNNASAVSSCRPAELDSLTSDQLDYFADHWLFLSEGLKQKESAVVIQKELPLQLDQVPLEVMPTALGE